MKRPAQFGAGLIEVAVALLVLSIGALGLARGQLAARQAASEALQRSEAVRLASSLLEQLHGNPGAFATRSFSELGALAVPARDCAQLSCSPSDWATWNLWYWRGQLEGSVVSNESGEAIAGLIAPQACFSVDQNVAALELYWRNTPSGTGHSCAGDNSLEGVRVLALETRLEAPVP